MAEIGKGEKAVRITLYVIAFIGIVVILVAKSQIPAFPLSAVILSIVGLLVLLGIMFVGYKFFNRSSLSNVQEEKLPEPKTVDEMIQFSKDVIDNDFADYVDGEGKYTTEVIGDHVKSSIFTYYAQGVHDDVLYVIVSNMHYPNKNRSALKNPSAIEIQHAKMSAASQPARSPDKKLTTVINPALGTQVVTEEITQPKTENKTEKEKKDL
jgi:hypothetical protein